MRVLLVTYNSAPGSPVRCAGHTSIWSTENDVRLLRRELEQALLEKALALSLEQHSAPEASTDAVLYNGDSFQPRLSEDMDRCVEHSALLHCMRLACSAECRRNDWAPLDAAGIIAP